MIKIKNLYPSPYSLIKRRIVEFFVVAVMLLSKVVMENIGLLAGTPAKIMGFLIGSAIFLYATFVLAEYVKRKRLIKESEERMRRF
jgi:hypothetical protein